MISDALRAPEIGKRSLHGAGTGCCCVSTREPAAFLLLDIFEFLISQGGKTSVFLPQREVAAAAWTQGVVCTTLPPEAISKIRKARAMAHSAAQCRRLDDLHQPAGIWTSRVGTVRRAGCYLITPPSCMERRCVMTTMVHSPRVPRADSTTFMSVCNVQTFTWISPVSLFGSSRKPLFIRRGQYKCTTRIHR